jgi:hypothetical protein
VVLTVVAMLLVLSGRPTFAQAPLLGAAVDKPTTAQTAGPPVEPFAITDNSFFIEEAFNQEPRVFQNIVTGLRGEDSGAWAIGFTQEWPAPSMTHQLSYTATLAHADHETGPGDVLLNYRYQLTTEAPGRPAMSPRVSIIMPVGDEERGLGRGAWGLQFNLPVSKQVGDFYLHGNAGLSWLPSVPTDMFPSVGFAPAEDVTIVNPFVGGSAIYRLKPMFNLMLEGLIDWRDDPVAPSATERDTVYIISPGARGGWNVGEKQVVVGLAFPVFRLSGDWKPGVFGYFSYELPF